MTTATAQNVSTAAQQGPNLEFLLASAANFLIKEYGGIEEATQALASDLREGSGDLGMAGHMHAKEAWNKLAVQALSNPQAVADRLNS